MIADASAPPVLLCKNCKHCKPGANYEGKPDFSTAKCKKSPLQTDLVTGSHRLLFCTTMREVESEIHCGEKGKLFEPIPV